MSATGSRNFAVLTVLLLATAALPARAQAPALPGLGMDMGSVSLLQQAGAPPAYGSYWVGHWMATSGWGGLENALRTAKATGVTPVVYWYYWGDSITPSCVENGCDGRTKAQWESMTLTLADKIRTHMGGARVVVVLENEFNKGGITATTYAPTFDGYLEARTKTLQGVPGVHVSIGFGSWGEDAWGRFPKAIAAADSIGFQLMRASTRDTEAQYRASPDKIAAVLSHIKSISGKGAFLYDVALSSYPEPAWRAIQAETLQGIMDRRAEYAQNGLAGIVYRELRDNPSMGTHNYYGIAEQYWGFRDTQGANKPAWNVWMAANNAKAPDVAPAAPNTPGLFEGEAMTPTTGGRNAEPAASGGATWNVWTDGELRQDLVSEKGGPHRVTVVARGTPASGVDARMEVRLNGTVAGSFVVPAGALREHAADVTLPAGRSVLAVAFTNDARTTTEDRNLYVDLVRVETPPQNRAPVARLSASASGLSLSADASASTDPDGDALAYAWDLGDGTTASGPRVSHAYAAPGDYVVTVRVADGKTASAASAPVKATQPNRAPDARLAVSGEKLSWSFDASATTDADGDALAYAWDLGDGAKASGARASHAYAAAGDYRVTLTVSDGTTASTTSTTISASAPNRAPVASFTAEGADLTWTFTATSTDADGDALTHAWRFPDGTSAEGVTVTKTFAAPGEHAVALTTSDGALSSEATRTVSARHPNRAPSADLKVAGADLAWSFDASGSTDADGDALTYAWTFGDGASGQGATASRTYASAGDYEVTLTVSDGKLSSTATTLVRAKEPNRAPVAAFTVRGADMTWTLDASDSADADGDALAYAWSFSDGTTASGAVVTKRFAQPGDHAVTLTVSDGKASAQASRNVTAKAPNRAPVASFTMGGADMTWRFDASNSTDADGDALTYRWTFGDGATAEGVRVTRTFGAAGDWDATLTVSDGQASGTAARTVQARVPNRAPVAAFTATGANLTWTFDASASADPDGDALAYAWSFPDGTTAMGVRVTKTFEQPGDHPVRLQVGDGRGAGNETTRIVQARATPAFRVQEAEAFLVKDNGAAFPDASASGGRGWLLWADGALRQGFAPGGGTFRVEVLAKGDPANGWPTMELRADGVVVGRWSVSTSTWAVYAADVPFTAGQARMLSVHFTNDYNGLAGDRNLRIDALRLAPPSVLIEAEAFAAKDNGAAFGDASASAGRGWVLWSNGAMRTPASPGAGGWNVEVVAKGDYAAGWPTMELRADGVVVGRWSVSTSTWQTYRATTSFPAEGATLSVHFVNDYHGAKGDRNLRIDAVRIVPQ